jgi:16S rRNA (adenine1518-N6/adenine1519-N6)-dimethyltransferase
VLVQLATERTGFHPVSRTVFRPRPNVDSALVAFHRKSLPARFDEIKRVVEGAFAHRRKTLPNSLELAGVADRARGAEALAALDRPATTRAEALAPEEFVELERSLA